MDIKDGGPAFPPNAGWRDNDQECRGMSLRDWFAGQSLAHMDMQTVAKKSDYSDAPEWIAKTAYKIADAMLDERKRGK